MKLRKKVTSTRGEEPITALMVKLKEDNASQISAQIYYAIDFFSTARLMTYNATAECFISALKTYLEEGISRVSEKSTRWFCF